MFRCCLKVKTSHTVDRWLFYFTKKCNFFSRVFIISPSEDFMRPIFYSNLFWESKHEYIFTHIDCSEYNRDTRSAFDAQTCNSECFSAVRVLFFHFFGKVSFSRGNIQLVQIRPTKSYRCYLKWRKLYSLLDFAGVWVYSDNL